METQNNENNDEQVIEDPKAVLSALERAKADAKKFREEKEELQKQLAEKDQSISQYSSKLLKDKVIQQFREEGINDADRLLKYVDMEKVQFDEEMNLIGFQDAYDQLKSDFPEIFDPKLRVGGQADAAITASVSTQYSATEMQAARILGRL